MVRSVNMFRTAIAAGIFLIMAPFASFGQGSCTGGPTIYTCTDETAFLNKLAEFGTCNVSAQGYESDADWGGSRFPGVQPEVVSQGIRWTSNNGVSNITTSNGAARTGNYGFFANPHGITTGTPFTVQRDGFIGYLSGTGAIIGAGGWMTSNTPGAQVRFVLDGQDVGFDNPAVSADFGFFGVIKADGFASFEVYESEGRVEDQKLIFADDFSICIGPFPNSAPVAANQSIRTPVSTSASVFLSADDPNGDLLTYAVVTPPAHGDLTGTPPNLTYSPDPGFGGPDSFTFRANDGEAFSNVATVSLAVDPLQKTFYFPQFVDGANPELGYWSALFLSNTGADSHVRIEFITTNGDPLPIELSGMGTNSTFNLTLARGESISLSTPGVGAIRSGYARITAGSGVDGVLVYTAFNVDTGVEFYQTAVSSSTPLRNFTMLVDSMQNYDTGLAIVFPKPLLERPEGAPAATITARLYDSANNLIAEKILDPLVSGGYFATFVNQLFAGDPAAVIAQEMQGLLTFESDQPLAAVTLRQDRPTAEFPLKMPSLSAFPVLAGRHD